MSYLAVEKFQGEKLLSTIFREMQQKWARKLAHFFVWDEIYKFYLTINP